MPPLPNPPPFPLFLTRVCCCGSVCNPGKKRKTRPPPSLFFLSFWKGGGGKSPHSPLPPSLPPGLMPDHALLPLFERTCQIGVCLAFGRGFGRGERRKVAITKKLQTTKKLPREIPSCRQLWATHIHSVFSPPFPPPPSLGGRCRRSKEETKVREEPSLTKIVKICVVVAAEGRRRGVGGAQCTRFPPPPLLQGGSSKEEGEIKVVKLISDRLRSHVQHAPPPPP